MSSESLVLPRKPVHVSQRRSVAPYEIVLGGADTVVFDHVAEQMRQLQIFWMMSAAKRSRDDVIHGRSELVGGVHVDFESAKTAVCSVTLRQFTDSRAVIAPHQYAVMRIAVAASYGFSHASVDRADA